jgi:ankyrin repeat protein
MQDSAYKKLIETLSYTFNDKSYLESALTLSCSRKQVSHPSFARNHQALATLGDGLLRAIIEDILLEMYSYASKGDLSRNRDSLVNNKFQTQIAIKLELAQFIVDPSSKLKAKGNAYDKSLADCLEAIIGAVFLDSGRNYLVAKRFVIIHWELLDIYDQWLLNSTRLNDGKRVDYLLQCGANPNLALYRRLRTDDSRDTLCFKIKGLKSQDEPDFPTTILIETVALKHLPIAKSLLQHGAKVNEVDALGMTALYTAACQGNLPMAKLLISHLANIGLGILVDGYTALHIAVYKNHGDMVEYLLEAGGDLNAKDWFGRSLLHIASECGHVQIARCLLNYGADINSCKINASVRESFFSLEHTLATPLHVAAKHKQIGIIKLLHKHQIDLNAIDCHGQTALHYAVKQGHYIVVRQLVQYGAKSDILDKEGNKPIDLTPDKSIKELLLSINSVNIRKTIYQNSDQGLLLFSSSNVHAISPMQEKLQDESVTQDETVSFKQAKDAMIANNNQYLDDDWQVRPACAIL